MVSADWSLICKTNQFKIAKIIDFLNFYTPQSTQILLKFSENVYRNG